MSVVKNEIVRRLNSNIVDLTENSRKENPTYANCLRFPIWILAFLWGIKWENGSAAYRLGFCSPHYNPNALCISFHTLNFGRANCFRNCGKCFCAKGVICNRGESDWITINLFQKWNFKPLTEHYVAFSREAGCTEAKTRPKRGTFHNVGFHKLGILTSWKKSILSRRQRPTCLTTSGAPNDNFRKISVRKTIWDLEFSAHLLLDFLLARLS